MIELKLRYCMELCLKNIYIRGNDYSIDVYGKPDVFVCLSLGHAPHEVYKKKEVRQPLLPALRTLCSAGGGDEGPSHVAAEVSGGVSCPGS